ncbi:MAG: hypothetical protein KF760_17135 [Candidatus Eremiobacteraeota bacterium]|nr:hypothetical protein [Candidatus Eremiobacteraeota bacterium]MCW5869027.1 hypothetical protein [Candidatus Eremiobacteraeota bacterium]
MRLPKIWTALLLALAVGNLMASELGLQIVVALLGILILPIPVGIATDNLARTLLAVISPFVFVMAVASLAIWLGPTVFEESSRGVAIALMQILPVATSNALCPPPYRLSILTAQTIWVWFVAALFLARGYVTLPWALLIALVGPMIFLMTAVVGRVRPAK